MEDLLDREEEDLLREIEASRQRLTQAADHLQRTLDPREAIRRHPVGGTLASLGAGIALGALGNPFSTLGGRRSKSARRERGTMGDLAGEALAALVSSIVPVLASVLLPTLIRPTGNDDQGSASHHG